MVRLVTNIIKWYNKKFRGILYAEDSVSMNDDEFGVFLELTPMQLMLTDKQKTEIVPLPWDSSEYDDYRVPAEEEQEQYKDPYYYTHLAADDSQHTKENE